MKLLQPVRIGTMTVPNRILVPAMVTRLSGEDGFVNQGIIDRYVRYSAGHVGLIVVEATAVHESKSGPLLRLSRDDFVQHEVPGMIWKEEPRDVLVKPGDVADVRLEPDDMNAGQVKATLQFSLPRGAYATMMIKRLFAPPFYVSGDEEGARGFVRRGPVGDRDADRGGDRGGQSGYDRDRGAPPRPGFSRGPRPFRGGDAPRSVAPRAPMPQGPRPGGDAPAPVEPQPMPFDYDDQGDS